MIRSCAPSREWERWSPQSSAWRFTAPNALAGPNAWTQEVYNGILSRCDLPQKAIAALARKLAVILWRLSLEKRPDRALCPA